MKIKGLSLSLLLLSSSAFAAPDNAASSLEDTLGKIKSFSAHFDQRIMDGEGHKVSHSKGKLAIKRPGTFYWEGSEPDPILVVGDGKTLWTYDKDLEQVTKQPLGDALKKTPAGLLAGEAKDLEKDFNVSFAESSYCVSEADMCFHLESKGAEKEFSDIYISMKQGLFVALKMHDQLGQQIFTQFSGIKLNGPVDESKFKFTPPKGVDVIENHKE